MDNVYVGRQAIFDDKLNVIAYELLFRADQYTNKANFDNEDLATADVLLNTITEIGMVHLVGQHRAFINLTYKHILEMAERPFIELKDRIVLEILKNVPIKEEIVTAVNSLSKQGFSIALDDFIYHESLQPLVDLSQVIKVDVLMLNDKELKEHVKKMANGKRKLLAEKVESEAMYKRCKELGFDYFQGYYFSHPQIIKGQKLPTNKMATLALLAKLQDPDSSTEELTDNISQDITMSMRVLRYINSAQFNFGKEIDSIQQAILMLGRSTIRNMANLITMSQIENKPDELIIISMIRAKMAENIASLTQANKDTCFTLGLFSVIDSLMDQEMSELTKCLPFPEEMKQALLDYDGELGKILHCVISYEKGDWDNAVHKSLTTDEVRNCFLNALEWTNSTSTILH